MTRPIDIPDLVARLAERAPLLCAELFPAGRREGHEYRVGSLAGEKGRSLAVHLDGARAGIWADFNGGDRGGDALDLVAGALYSGDKGAAVKWARAWLGLDAGAPAARRPVAAKKENRSDDQGARQYAWRIWLASRPRIRGTLADAYLRGRGLDLHRLGRQPASLRYHPRLAYRDGGAWPALVAAICGADGRIVAVHRTWLAENPGGGVIKAPVRDPKMTLGRYRGGAIRLWRGASGEPLAQAPADDTVAICEGIEDGLTIALAKPDLRVLVAVSLSNMGSVILPKQIGTVILVVDNDGDNQAAAKAVDRAVRHYQQQGHRVKIARPKFAKDVNDLARGVQ